MPVLRKLLGAIVPLLLVSSLFACSTPVSPTPTQAPVATAIATRTRPAPTETRPPTAAPTQAPPSVEITATLAITPTATTAPISVQPTSGAEAHGDKYQYVSQNIADNTQVKPGTPLTIVWTVKNAGTVAWSTDYTLRFFAGPQPEKQSYNFPRSVKPGEELQLSVPIVAPQEPGNYNFWWKLTNNQNQNFGDVNFMFTVTNTPGVSPTNTPTS